MKRLSTLFLKAVILLMGVGILVWMLYMPQFEGRNVHATFTQIYFQDPFLAYIYISSIPFFVSLFQVFKLLGYIEQNKAFSQASVKALRRIKYCALITAGCIVCAVSFIFFTSVEDDPAGFIALGTYMTFATIVVATAAAVFERLLQKAVDMKSENDLTV